MNKILVFIMAAAMLMAGGCATVMEQPASGAPAAVGANASADVKPWPTKLWSTSAPEAQGMRSPVLAQADEYIAGSFPNVYSLLVVRHGYLVYEKYYNGMDADNANRVYSVTKSVLSALTGIAIEQKLIQSVDQPVAELLPEYFEQIDDAAKKEITVRHVLTMSGGLESIDKNYAPFFSSPDWLAYTLSLPFTDKPGARFAYNTGLTQFLANGIAQTSGMDAKEYAEKYLFSEIGMHCESWDRDPDGHYGGGTGLYLTPRDMARFGYLYLNSGEWDGRQVVPGEWVEESTKKQIAASGQTDYGYLFWLEAAHDDAKNTDYNTYRADGAGGQKIIVVPELDMVAVITANEYNASPSEADTQNIVYKYVIPSCE